MSRFQLRPAQRSALPLFLGLCGPSGSGKTYSALRLATGVQKVVGGKIAVVDTEAARALHYADTFSFEHVPFVPPFSPDDYWEAISTCVEAGAKTIVIDSMSHEHEGPGGVLEWHEAEVRRLAAQWRTSEANVQFPAWAEPKAARRRLLNNILQVQVNLIMCFRAKRKVAMPTAEQKAQGQRQPIDLGWMPVAGAEYAYELTALAVLTPGSKGVPDWDVKDPGTEMVVKRPAQFEQILGGGQQLTERMGEAMARWAQGTPVAEPTLGAQAQQLLELIGQAQTETLLGPIVESLNQAREAKTLNKAEQAALRKALDAARARLKMAVTAGDHVQDLAGAGGGK